MKKVARKKICFLTNSLETSKGGGRFSDDLIENVRAFEEFDIEVLTTVSSGYESEKSILYPNKIKLFFSLLKIRRIINGCDIVHALDGFPYGVIATIASFGLGKKIIITAIGSGSIRPLYNPIQKILLTFSYRTAAVITAISSYTAKEIKKKLPNLSIQVVIPGIDYEYFTKKNSPEAVKNFSMEKPFILSVAKLKRRKGHHISLRAFAEVSSNLPDLKYVIVGNGRGAYYKEIRELISQLKIEDKVIFKQNIPDEELFYLYKNAELFVLLPQNDNYDVEGFGLVFVEAAAFGIPVLGALDSGAEDAVLDGKNGFLVKPDDIDSAAKKIEEIINNNQLRLEFSKKSMEFAKKNDWGNIIKQYIEIYHNL